MRCFTASSSASCRCTRAAGADEGAGTMQPNGLRRVRLCHLACRSMLGTCRASHCMHAVQRQCSVRAETTQSPAQPRPPRCRPQPPPAAAARRRLRHAGPSHRPEEEESRAVNTCIEKGNRAPLHLVGSSAFTRRRASPRRCSASPLAKTTKPLLLPAPECAEAPWRRWGCAAVPGRRDPAGTAPHPPLTDAAASPAPPENCARGGEAGEVSGAGARAPAAAGGGGSGGGGAAGRSSALMRLPGILIASRRRPSCSAPLQRLLAGLARAGLVDIGLGVKARIGEGAQVRHRRRSAAPSRPRLQPAAGLELERPVPAPRLTTVASSWY